MERPLQRNIERDLSDHVLLVACCLSLSNCFTFFKSAHANFFAGGLRNRYAGWNVGTKGIPSYSAMDPRIFVIATCGPSIAFAATAPKTQITDGRTMAICSRRNGKHASTSSGSGVRLPGGRSFSTLQM